MILVAGIITTTLIITGMLLCVAAPVGSMRFRGTISCMHAPSKPQMLGLILTLSGSFVYIATHASAHTTTSSDLALLTLIILSALGTSPIVSNRVGHEAFKERLVDEDSLARDDSREQREDNGLRLLTGLMTK